MSDILTRKGTRVWALICILTILSTFLGEHHAPLSFLDKSTLPILILAIAAIKVRLIIMHFMEIADSPLPLRLIFELWIASVFILLLMMFTMAQG